MIPRENIKRTEARGTPVKLHPAKCQVYPKTWSAKPSLRNKGVLKDLQGRHTWPHSKTIGYILSLTWRRKDPSSTWGKKQLRVNRFASTSPKSARVSRGLLNPLTATSLQFDPLSLQEWTWNFQGISTIGKRLFQNHVHAQLQNRQVRMLPLREYILHCQNPPRANEAQIAHCICRRALYWEKMLERTKE